MMIVHLSKPDYVFWGRKYKDWSSQEFAALLCDVEPREVLDEIARPFRPEGNIFDKFYEIFEFLKISGPDDINGFTMGFPGAFSAKARVLLEWAKNMELPYSPELEKQVRRFDKAWVDEPAKEELNANVLKDKLTKLEEELRLNPKTRTSLLCILYAMARNKFEFKHIGNSSAAGNIRTALMLYGLPGTEKTIREWLQEAAECAEANTSDPEKLKR